MPRLVTVQEMVDAVRSRGDFQLDPHKSDAEIMSWLSAAYGELYDILVSSGLDYYEASEDYTTTGLTDTYTMAADYYGTKRVDYIFSAETKWPVREISLRRLHQVSTSGQRAAFYRTVGPNIILYPRPPAGQTYRHLYIPAPAKLTSLVQTIDGVSGWEEHLVVGAIIRGKEKSDLDTSSFQIDRQRTEARIQQAAQNRAIASATSLVEEDTYDNDWSQDPANWRQY
jgi:hypothetical protein